MYVYASREQYACQGGTRTYRHAYSNISAPACKCNEILLHTCRRSSEGMFTYFSTNMYYMDAVETLEFSLLDFVCHTRMWLILCC